MSDYINNMMWLISANRVIAGAVLLALVMLIIIIYGRHISSVDAQKKYKVGGIILLIFITALFALNIVVSVNIDNDVEYIKTDIYEEYNLAVSNNDIKDSIISSSISDTGVSECMMARANGDTSRVYEVYIVDIDNDNNFSLCTRSEKGIYIPITSVSKDALDK